MPKMEARLTEGEIKTAIVYWLANDCPSVTDTAGVHLRFSPGGNDPREHDAFSATAPIAK